MKIRLIDDGTYIEVQKMLPANGTAFYWNTAFLNDFLIDPSFAFDNLGDDATPIRLLTSVPNTVIITAVYDKIKASEALTAIEIAPVLPNPLLSPIDQSAISC